MLSPDEFGLAAAGLITIGFFQIFLQTGIRPAVIQRPELTDLHVRCAFTLSLELGFVLAAAVILGADSLAAWLFDMPELAPVLRAGCFDATASKFGRCGGSEARERAEFFRDRAD